MRDCQCIHTHRIGTISRVDSSPIKQESNILHGLALSFTEGVHEFTELGRALDLEEDFVVVVGDLDVQVLGLGLLFWVASATWRLLAVRHCALSGECEFTSDRMTRRGPSTSLLSQKQDDELYRRDWLRSVDGLCTRQGPNSCP